ncbi:MAG: acyltransferase family protein, partial [Rhodospirillales bacterium]
MPGKPEPGYSATGDIERRRILALIAVPLISAGYGWYLASGTDIELYQYSKSLASYDYRQHLGLSKRFLLQYGHMIFLFSLLVCTKYLCTGNWFSGRQSAVITTGAAYTVPVFIFHFPLLYFIAAIIGHDPASDASQTLLLVLTTISSILAGKACMLIKPRFDGIKRRYLDRINQRANPAAPDSGSPVRADAMTMTQTHSDVMNIVKILAMAAIVLGHFSFDVFSVWRIPGFDGNAPRFAVPVFFMISGYFAMMSLDRTVGNVTKVVLKRYWSLVYLVVPMLLLTPVLDAVGFALDPGLYDRVVYFD